MRYRTFGRTDWSVSEVGYGMWGIAGWTGSDDAESLGSLQRAIEMVRGATRGGRTHTDSGIAPPADMAAKRSPPGRVVEICHDPSFEAAYAAKDATSGLVVIRHQDSARLRAMCDRMGWQVVDGADP